jgi:hypothetical protein
MNLLAHDHDLDVCAAGESSVLFIIYVYVVVQHTSRLLMVDESESQELDLLIAS